jgi:hypothetical protein
MNQSRNNPPTNKLPDSLRRDRVVEAVRRSGYPLQTVVAQALMQQFQVRRNGGTLIATGKSIGP